MPVYEYRCQACGRKFQTLVGVVAGPEDTKCVHCGSPATTRLVSRFARYRNEDDRLDEIAERMDRVNDSDPAQTMEHMVRDLGKAMDDDASEELGEMFDSDGLED